MNSAAIEARKRIRNGSIIALAALAGLALGASSLYKGCKTNEELEQIESDFANVANLQEPERHGTLGYFSLDYNGSLDQILERRDNFVAERGCLGIGSWNVNEYYITDDFPQQTIDFNYSVICLPF